jgi:dUTPase
MRGQIGDAGLDCFADLFSDTFMVKRDSCVLTFSDVRDGFDAFVLSPLDVAKIPLGFRCAFFVDGRPSTDYWLEICNRSGFGTVAGVVPLASVVDSSYRGVPHYSIAKVVPGVVRITHGQKICQAVIHPFVDPHKVQVEIVSSIDDLGVTSRGDAGFGSTGG